MHSAFYGVRLGSAVSPILSVSLLLGAKLSSGEPLEHLAQPRHGCLGMHPSPPPGWDLEETEAAREGRR